MNGGTATFTVTKDDGPPPASIDWPVEVAPTVSARTTLKANGLSASTNVKMQLASTRGPVEQQCRCDCVGADVKRSGAAGLVVRRWKPCQLQEHLLGLRVAAFGYCDTVRRRLSSHVTIPDGLGGWHVVQLMQNGHLVAEVPFYVRESIVGQGVSSIVIKQGHPFTIHLKGVGWTQLDNTVAVDYDNSYMGYGCGFNSNGDVMLNLNAQALPGTHLIDIYPMLYTLSPSFANTPYGMVPVLTYAATSLAWRSVTTCRRSARDHGRASRTLAVRSHSPSKQPRSRSLSRGEASTRARRATASGSHQFQRPSNDIRLGMSRPRTTVASSRTPRRARRRAPADRPRRPTTRPDECPDHDQGRRAHDPAGMGQPVDDRRACCHRRPCPTPLACALTKKTS